MNTYKALTSVPSRRQEVSMAKTQNDKKLQKEGSMNLKLLLSHSLDCNDLYKLQNLLLEKVLNIFFSHP